MIELPTCGLQVPMDMPLQLMPQLLAQVSLTAQLLPGMLRIEARTKLPRLRSVCLELSACSAIQRRIEPRKRGLLLLESMPGVANAPL